MYLGHRRFLPLNHQVRKKGKHFKGTPDHRKKPHNQTGEDVLAMVKDVKVVFGKGQGSESVPKDANGHAPMWKKKSIFWELPYWQVLEIRNKVHSDALQRRLRSRRQRRPREKELFLKKYFLKRLMSK